jgi:hypothetical protein
MDQIKINGKILTTLFVDVRLGDLDISIVGTTFRAIENSIKFERHN